MIESLGYHRNTTRLPDWNYTGTGAYFITLAAYGHDCLFGEISTGQVSLNAFGEIVREEWLRTPEVRPEITLDEFVIMPNHLHGIIIITESNTIGAKDTPPSVGALVTPSSVGAHGRAPLPNLPLPNLPLPNLPLPNLPLPNLPLPNLPLPNLPLPNLPLPNLPLPDPTLPDPTLPDPTLHRQPKSLGSFVAGFKSIVTKRINILRATPGMPVWQRNYYEHIIRDDQDMKRIRAYIHNNPLQWISDHEYPTP